MELLPGFETIGSSPAVYCAALDAVVIADTHIGVEVVESRSGALMPRFQLEDVIEEVEADQEACGASRIIVVGDIKHSFRGDSDAEREEVERFLEALSMAFERVDLVRGNHDAALEYRAEDLTNVAVQDAIVEEDIVFLHGDRPLSAYEDLGVETVGTIVMGHEHPAVALKGAVGVKEKLACFLYGTQEGRSVLVLPAFSHLASGTEVNAVPVSRLLSPVLKEEFDVDGLHVTAVDREAGILDFTELGELRSL